MSHQPTPGKGFGMDDVPQPKPRAPRQVDHWPFRDVYGDSWWDEQDRDPYEYGGTGTSEDVNPNEGSKG